MIQAHYPPNDQYRPVLETRYDVVIIGAGPAGTTTGALLAEQGHSVAILERHSVPRFHVGESLIPETYWTLKKLGLIERMKQSAYPKKFSVQFVSDGWKESAPFYFDAHNDHESSQTWQVERADFDQMLLENAIEKGASAHTDAQVLELLTSGESVTGVRVKLKKQEDVPAEVREIRSRVVIDASGQAAFIASRRKLKNSDPLLRKGSIWTYFQGAQRDAGRDEGATIILQTEGKQSWFWYIPLRDDVVSVGCTGEMHMMFPPGGTAEETFQRELSRCPALQKRLANAQQLFDFFTTKDYSYKSKQAAGNGWVLVGDAYGFIDPVYSSGVYLALKGGEFVADAVHEALIKNDLSAKALGCWQSTYDAGIENFRKLVYAFYTPGFSFGEFLREHPEHHGRLVDILIGAVFKPDVKKIFDDMGNVMPVSDRTTDPPE